MEILQLIWFWGAIVMFVVMFFEIGLGMIFPPAWFIAGGVAVFWPVPVTWFIYKFSTGGKVWLREYLAERARIRKLDQW